MTWIELIDNAIKIILPGLLVYLATRYTVSKQLETKVLEIKGNAEFKAREHLFKIYQKELEKNEKSFGQIDNQIRESITRFFEISEQRKREQFINSFIRGFQFANAAIESHINFFETESKKDELFSDLQTAIASARSLLIDINQALSNFNAKSSYDEMEDLRHMYIALNGLVSALDKENLKRKSEDLFAPYLKDMKSK